jgi:limonene-1,2-epoxide hydrolase
MGAAGGERPDERNRELIEAFWQDLERRDFDRIGSYFAEDGHYEDVPTPDSGATGPEAIAARLRVGLAPIEDYVHHLHRMVVAGGTVVTEHTEDWHFGDGVVVSLPFVSLHVIEDGRIKLWRDYWDLQTLLGSAPQWWLEHIMKAGEEAGLR